MLLRIALLLGKVHRYLCSILEAVLLKIHFEIHVLLLDGTDAFNVCELVEAPHARDRLVRSEVDLLALPMPLSVLPIA